MQKVRRPRAATSDSTTRPPLHPQLVEGGTNVAPSTSHQPSSFHFTTNGGPPPPSPQPIPSSSESLQSPSTPPNHTSSRRRTNPASSPGAGALPSPPLSSSHQPDPLAGFGHRLLRRISNQGGSSSSSNTASPASLRPTSAGTGTGGGRSSSTPPPAAPSNGAAAAGARRAEGEGLELQRESPRGEHARELLVFGFFWFFSFGPGPEEEAKGKTRSSLPPIDLPPNGEFLFPWADLVVLLFASPKPSQPSSSPTLPTLSFPPLSTRFLSSSPPLAPSSSPTLFPLPSSSRPLLPQAQAQPQPPWLSSIASVSFLSWTLPTPSPSTPSFETFENPLRRRRRRRWTCSLSR